MSTENTRPLLLSLIIMTTLSLVPMLSHGAVFWDDEMEQGNTGFSEAYMLNTLIPGGNMAYDTNVKYSGNGSVRLNYPPSCSVGVVGGQQCGGSIGRSFPASLSVWKRVYFRMSGSGPNPTSTGLFQTSPQAFTKLLKGQSAVVNDLNARHWWTMGCCGSKTFMITMEHVPTYYQSTNAFSSITFQDNRWYCIETHEVMNTPSVADGVAEAWVDGVKVLAKTDAIWQRVGSDFTWREFSIIRQEGIGNLWFDRFAAGNTRIGCLGATSASDTTRPAPPQGLVIR